MSKFKWSIKFDGNEQNDKFPMSPSRSTLVFIGLSLIWWAYVLYLAYCFAFNPCNEIWNPQSMEVFLIRGRGYHSLQRLCIGSLGWKRKGDQDTLVETGLDRLCACNSGTWRVAPGHCQISRAILLPQILLGFRGTLTPITPVCCLTLPDRALPKTKMKFSPLYYISQYPLIFCFDSYYNDTMALDKTCNATAVYISIDGR